MARKTLSELNLSDAFLFAAVMEEPDACRLVLEQILGKRIPDMRVHAEHSILYAPSLRSIRLDVFASDKKQNRYNLEMENWEKSSLAKRSRFHLAEMDAAGLQPGDAFQQLKPSYVIFICTFDPFGRDLYRYTFEAKCREIDMNLCDGTTRIFLNTKGKNAEEVPKTLVNFLHYVENTSDEYAESTGDPRIAELHGKIRALKKSRRWEERYMTIGDWLHYQEEEIKQEGKQEGKQEERDRLMRLIIRMNQEGETEQLLQLEQDTGLLERLYQKYHL